MNKKQKIENRLQELELKLNTAKATQSSAEANNEAVKTLTGKDAEKIKTTVQLELNNAKAAVKSIETEIVSLEKQAKEYKEVDWANHKHPEVRSAWDNTIETAKNLHFTSRTNPQMVSEFIASDDQMFCIIAGPTGTGKSSLIRYAAAEQEKPVLSQNYSNGLEEMDIIGGPVADGKGSFKYVDGPLVVAMKEGLTYVAEEINFARPGILAILNSLLDSNRSIVSADGTIVRAHKDFKFFGTLNDKYRGTKELNKALVNRVDLIIYLDKPSLHQIKEIVKRQTGLAASGDKDEEIMLARLAMLYKLIEETIKKTNVDSAISPRQLISMVKLLKQGQSFMNAFNGGVLHQVANFNHQIKPAFEACATNAYKMDGNKLLSSTAKAAAKESSEEAKADAKEAK